MRLLNKRSLRTSTLAALAVLLVSAAASGLIIWRLEVDGLRAERARAGDMSNPYVDAIDRELERPISSLFILAALVRQSGGLIPNFNNVAQGIMDMHSGVASVAVLPDGRVRQIYPMEANAERIGMDLFDDPQLKTGAILARETGMVSASGPYPSGTDGEMQLVIQYAVYLEDMERTPAFWGLTAITLNLPAMLEDIQLSRLEEQGMDYVLWRRRPEDQETQILAASTDGTLRLPVERIIHLPNGDWVLSVAPNDGWGDPWQSILRICLGLVISLMLAYLLKLLIEAKANEAELERRAHFDALTGLPNRRLLYDRLIQNAAQVRRTGTSMAVCYLDMDGFKTVNDTLGHEAGDTLLVVIARRLEECLRAGDTVARIGGDEFVVILHSLPHPDDVVAALRRILAVVNRPVEINGHTIPVSVSIGVTLYPQDDGDIEILLRHADIAMYNAKTSQKGGYCLYTPDPNQALN